MTCATCRIIHAADPGAPSSAYTYNLPPLFLPVRQELTGERVQKHCCHLPSTLHSLSNVLH